MLWGILKDVVRERDSQRTQSKTSVWRYGVWRPYLKTKKTETQTNKKTKPNPTTAKNLDSVRALRGLGLTS